MIVYYTFAYIVCLLIAHCFSAKFLLFSTFCLFLLHCIYSLLFMFVLFGTPAMLGVPFI